MGDVSALVALAAMGYGCEIGRVGLQEQPVEAYGGDAFSEVGVFEGDDAVDAEVVVADGSDASDVVVRAAEAVHHHGHGGV